MKAEPLPLTHEQESFNEDLAIVFAKALTEKSCRLIMAIGITERGRMELLTPPPEELSRKTVRRMLKQLYQKI